jgi:hypothetical protein
MVVRLEEHWFFGSLGSGCMKLRIARFNENRRWSQGSPDNPAKNLRASSLSSSISTPGLTAFQLYVLNGSWKLFKGNTTHTRDGD